VDDFEGFFDQHYGPTLRAVTLTIGDAGRAEDLTQEAFARAFRRWSTVSKLERPRRVGVRRRAQRGAKTVAA